MDAELATILSQDPRYAAAYNEFLETHKNGYGKNSTEEELATFVRFFEWDFLNGIKNDCSQRRNISKKTKIVISAWRDLIQIEKIRWENS